MEAKTDKQRKTVLTYGTFDLFHIGHVRLLKRLRELGDQLIVGVSSDEFNAAKNKSAIFPFKQREEILLSCRYVDKVIAEKSWEQKAEDIKRFDVDIFAMGDDWVGKFDELKAYCKVVYLPRTDGISSSEVRQIIQSPQGEGHQAMGILAEQLLATLGKK